MVELLDEEELEVETPPPAGVDRLTIAIPLASVRKDWPKYSIVGADVPPMFRVALAVFFPGIEVTHRSNGKEPFGV